jgi:hypothetical protein
LTKLWNFSPKVWSPLKFKQNSHGFSFLNFQFKFCWEFELISKRKVVLSEMIYHLVKSGKIWRKGGTTFVFFKFGLTGVLEKDIKTMELGPAHHYSSDPAGPPGQLLQHAHVAPGHKADRRRRRSPTSPPRFPRRLLVDRCPRSHATHRRHAHSLSSPLLLVPACPRPTTDTHSLTALPLVLSTTPPYLPQQVKANPFSSSSRSPLLALLFNGHQSCHCMVLSTACHAALLSAL